MTFTCTGWVLIYAQLTCVMPEPAPAVICPPVRTWTREFQKAVATEMRASPNSAMAKVVVQSIGDRDVARACRAKRAKSK